MSLTITIIGLGRAGRQLARASVAAGLATTLVSRRNSALQQLAAELRGIETRVWPECDAQPMYLESDLVVLAVRDQEIAAVAERVRAPHTSALLHLSGAAGPSVLRERAERDENLVAAHPLLSFSSEPGAALPPGTMWGVSAESTRGAELTAEWVGALAGTCVAVPQGARAEWHLAATLASNGVYALLAAVESVLDNALQPSVAEREKLVEAFAALSAQSAQSAAQHGLVRATTGPVVRGDSGTVSRHLHALKHQPDTLALYRLLGHFLIDVAERRELPDSLLAALRVQLEGEG